MKNTRKTLLLGGLAASLLTGCATSTNGFRNALAMGDDFKAVQRPARTEYNSRALRTDVVETNPKTTTKFNTEWLFLGDIPYELKINEAPESGKAPFVLRGVEEGYSNLNPTTGELETVTRDVIIPERVTNPSTGQLYTTITISNAWNPGDLYENTSGRSMAVRKVSQRDFNETIDPYILDLTKYGLGLWVTNFETKGDNVPEVIAMAPLDGLDTRGYSPDGSLTVGEDDGLYIFGSTPSNRFGRVSSDTYNARVAVQKREAERLKEVERLAAEPSVKIE